MQQTEEDLYQEHLTALQEQLKGLKDWQPYPVEVAIGSDIYWADKNEGFRDFYHRVDQLMYKRQKKIKRFIRRRKMTESRQKVFDVLERLGIQVEWEEHPPVFTIDEMDDLGISGRGCVVKNLFLRDAKGKRHFLVVLAKDKQADLKGLQERIGCSKLSFASEDRLKKHLDLTKGAVTPPWCHK